MNNFLNILYLRCYILMQRMTPDTNSLVRVCIDHTIVAINHHINRSSYHYIGSSSRGIARYSQMCQQVMAWSHDCIWAPRSIVPTNHAWSHDCTGEPRSIVPTSHAWSHDCTLFICDMDHPFTNIA